MTQRTAAKEIITELIATKYIPMKYPFLKNDERFTGLAYLRVFPYMRIVMQCISVDHDPRS